MKTSVPISSLLHHKGSTVWHVSPEATVFDAIQLMADKNIGALPVMSHGRLAGIFTERDYTRKIALAGKTSKQTLVKEITSADPWLRQSHLPFAQRPRMVQPVPKGPDGASCSRLVFSYS